MAKLQQWPGEEETRYLEPDIRSFEVYLHLMPTHDIAGFLESAYVEAMKSNVTPLFLRELADILTKRSNDKRNFLPHAKRLRDLAELRESERVSSYMEGSGEALESGVANDNVVNPLRTANAALLERVLTTSPLRRRGED